MKNPLISIIIPLFNKGEYIANTLQSILNQKVDDIEIIIVNDGSTDNGPDIIETFKDKRIRIYHQINSGVSAARNFGIHNAKGDWIYLFDADDYMHPNSLNLLYNEAKQNNGDIILTKFDTQYDECIKESNTKIKLGEIRDPFWKIVIYKLKIRIGSILVKTEIAKSELFNIGLSRYEDHDVFYRWLSKSKVFFLPIKLMQYDVRAARESKINQENYNRDFLFNLDFKNKGFWYKCQLGKLLYEGYQSYSEKKTLLKKKYKQNERVYYFSGYILALLSRVRTSHIITNK